MEYEIDQRDRIVWVSNDWQGFATTNGGVDLVGDAVIGRPLMDFVVGDATQMLYQTLMDKVRRVGTKVQHEFRCDSPDMRRRLLMTLTPLEVHGIRFSTQTLESSPPKKRVRFVSSSEQMRRRCSICGRVSQGDGPFVEPENLSVAIQPVAVCYAVCEECRARVQALLKS